MARLSTAKRLLLGAAAAFAALALLAVLIGPRLLSGVVAKRAESELSARGIEATIEGLRIGLRSVRVGRVCVDYPEPANGALLCVEAAEVDIDLLRAARGHVEVQAVRVDAVEIDARGERGALPQLQEAITSLIPAFEEGAPDAPPSPGEGGATEPPALPPVEVGRAILRTGSQGLPLEGVELTEVRIDSEDGHTA